MADGKDDSRLFGGGKGTGAAVLFLVLGFIGVITCLVFRRIKAIWKLEPPATPKEKEQTTH